MDEEPAGEPTESNKTGLLLLVVLVVLGGAGGFFFLKKNKAKSTQNVGPDPDFDYNEDEEDYLAGLDEEDDIIEEISDEEE